MLIHHLNQSMNYVILDDGEYWGTVAQFLLSCNITANGSIQICNSTSFCILHFTIISGGISISTLMALMDMLAT